ncbi:hypothetical protein [Halobellus captivus]|uniref:hypothetical protein n=1 Tax=Halobellus captivus TaxID=2592614 RepID=UPI00119F5DD9|nr:hypothetical protein [Halobellus captivus]
MTDAEAADAVDEAAADADPDAAEHDNEEEPPEIDEEDQADLPADLAAEAEEAAGAAADQEDGDSDESDEDDSETDSSTSTSTSSSVKGDTYGDLYAQTLVSVTNAAIEEHGKPDAEKTDLEAAKQLGIPDHANRLVDEMGIGQEMPPGQALMASSAIFVLMNVSAKTDLPQQMMGDLEL